MTDTTSETASDSAVEQHSTTLLGGHSQEQQNAGSSLLGGQGQEQTTADKPFSFPEQFQVKSGDELDFTASAQKLAEAYSSLESRVGSGEARPETPGDYVFGESFGEGFGESFLNNPAAKPFIEKAHELGMNNAQMNFMMAELLASQPAQAETSTGFTMDQAQQDLQKTWADPGEYNRNMQAADRAAKFGFGDDYSRCLSRYGNDPAIIRLLAKIGGELSEDTIRLSGLPQMTADSIDDLMKSDAYRDANHPDHRRVAQQVRTYWQKSAGTDEFH